MHLRESNSNESFPIDKLTEQDQKNIFRKLQIIPTLFLSKGQCVLKNAKDNKYEYFKNPFELSATFSVNSDMLIVDIDECNGCGNNRDIIKKISMAYKCYVSNGAKDKEIINDYLSNNVKRVVISPKNLDIIKEVHPNRLIMRVKVDKELKMIEEDKTLFAFVNEIKNDINFLYIDLKNKKKRS